ncbi:hypothetical protein BAUCODRAFT_332365 [Baudoinia panamericana UAMH 10762]|uniref:Uncharacterized protein n=1 Tax=Baudoinia panamericana (strain UAMH 10762) TaxID=717646 RepID=M2MXH5_BAUPA|nr:uncharacterized protein BAUCODRAFT_332365 [Baudoinia panamericana UAMH 10762]EMC90955.1 hypothetical protein BAUCODRAFT_332365 [Baudoinia panamericana UAMH 10762]
MAHSSDVGILQSAALPLRLALEMSCFRHFPLPIVESVQRFVNIVVEMVGVARAPGIDATGSIEVVLALLPLNMMINGLSALPTSSALSTLRNGQLHLRQSRPDPRQPWWYRCHRVGI